MIQRLPEADVPVTFISPGETDVYPWRLSTESLAFLRAAVERAIMAHWRGARRTGLVPPQPLVSAARPSLLTIVPFIPGFCD